MNEKFVGFGVADSPHRIEDAAHGIMLDTLWNSGWLSEVPIGCLAGIYDVRIGEPWDFPTCASLNQTAGDYSLDAIAETRGYSQRYLRSVMTWTTSCKNISDSRDPTNTLQRASRQKS
jgi:hypothetical protein